MVAVTSVTNVEKSVRENPGKGGIGAPGSKIKNMRSILDLDQVGGNYFEDKNKRDLQRFCISGTRMHLYKAISRDSFQ